MHAIPKSKCIVLTRIESAGVRFDSHHVTTLYEKDSGSENIQEQERSDDRICICHDEEMIILQIEGDRRDRLAANDFACITAGCEALSSWLRLCFRIPYTYDVVYQGFY